MSGAIRAAVAIVIACGAPIAVGFGCSGGASAPAPGATSPCGAPHLFCDDFDLGDFGRTWDDSVVSEAGTLGRDDASFRSPPFALRARSPAEIAARSLVLYKKLPE